MLIRLLLAGTQSPQLGAQGSSASSKDHLPTTNGGGAATKKAGGHRRDRSAAASSRASTDIEDNVDIIVGPTFVFNCHYIYTHI